MNYWQMHIKFESIIPNKYVVLGIKARPSYKIYSGGTLIESSGGESENLRIQESAFPTF